MNERFTRLPVTSGGIVPVTPAVLPISDALARSAPLVSLRQRMRDSAARFESIRGVVPAALQAHMQPGPLDDESWSLVAANAAVAAKLRHLQPLIDSALQQQGWPPRSLRVKVAGR